MAISLLPGRLSPLFQVLIFLCCVKPASAAEMKFGWPVACIPSQTCWIVNYVDDGPSKTSARDFQCGDMTYPGHDGTDIAIKDHKTIEDNINVLAAADGTVLRIRDSVEDGKGETSVMNASREAKKECGNGVIITHENGWETIYCHMKKGSISVSPGQHVHTGDRLGSVGQSGLAEFPHLHFGVKHDNRTIDPFTGLPPEEGCGIKNTISLWNTPIAYDPLMPYAAGFSDQLPDNVLLVNDTSSPPHITATVPLMTFWILFYGAEPDDRLIMKILDPDGKVYAQNDSILKQKKIRLMKYIGARIKDKPLHPGTYAGQAILLRELPDGQILRRSIESTVIVDAPH